MLEELKKQIERMENQLESEKMVVKAWESYTESALKTIVLNQAHGVIRGLEVGLESLEYVLDRAEPKNVQMTTENWLENDSRIKEIIKQIDTRGGMVVVSMSKKARKEFANQ